MASPYQTNPNNYLGNEYNTYLAKLTAYAIKNPSDYIDLRLSVAEKVKTKQIQILYDNFFSILKNGTMKLEASGAAIKLVDAVSPEGPCYPEQKINQFTLSIVDKFNEIIDELLDIILPDKTNNVLGNTIAKSDLV